MRVLLPALALLGVAASLSAAGSATRTGSVSQDAILSSMAPATLSAFGFFDGDAAVPSAELIPYTLSTPLFSDYSEKQRFIYLPPSGVLKAEEGDGRLDFPVGSAIVKSFGYPSGTGALKVIETRVLLRKAAGWVALPYIWRADGKDADLRVGGARVAVHFKTPSGEAKDINYGVPNKNQCKQCHSTNGEIMPIGPMLGNMAFPSSIAQKRFFARLAEPNIPVMKWAKWDDPKSGSLNQRATSYLRINCGHCHSPAGSASNSGLFFDGKDHGQANAGINKRPVAAGRGSGNMDFVIAPGHPEKSILIYRLKSLDPGISMPELGRTTAHDEGVMLLEEWIASMKTDKT
jgi:uncharacterized repeat protein (TIGR03806 family)